MKKYLASVAMMAALVAPACADTVCDINDTFGNALTYQFAPNNEDTMVETGFVKNGVVTVSPVGWRPLWSFSQNGHELVSNDAPDWSIVLHRDRTALLFHSGRIAGIGECVVTADFNADQGFN
jgi:hypothetical protein